MQKGWGSLEHDRHLGSRGRGPQIKAGAEEMEVEGRCKHTKKDKLQHLEIAFAVEGEEKFLKNSFIH